MAIVTGYMEGARKKVAGFVYQKGANGQTIKRAYVIPSNPQTEGQMAQRIIFATVAQARKFMKPIINHSYEGVAYGKKSEEKFDSLNIAQLRQMAAIDFERQPQAADASVFVSTKNISALIPNKYIISDGSLSNPAAKVSFSDSKAMLSLGGASGFAVVPHEDAEVGGYDITLGEVIRALFGLTDVNEQLTLCAIVRNDDGYRYSYQGSTEAGAQIAPTGFNAKRLVFNETADLGQLIHVLNADGTVNDDAEANIGTAVSTAFNNKLSDKSLRDLVENAITSNIRLNVSGLTAEDYKVSWNSFTININDLYVYDIENDYVYVYALGMIRSKLVGKNWRRSRTVMIINTPVKGTLSNFGLTWNLANAAWFDKVQLTDDGYFLNEAGTDNQVGDSF